ncbi:MAG: hypothetical protein OXF86_09165 [Caldilineaceae bacterium]|nr:hypothetical protein [Caldilineaceae bacterium]
MSRQRNDTRSDWFVLLLLLGAVLLFIIIALGARAVSSPSNSRITALETQISQLSSEIATLQPTPTPTNTPRPTHTPTPTPTRTPTRAPTATDTPTPRLRPESYSQTLTVIVAHANVREGPSTAYEVLDTVQQNETFKGPFSEQDGWYRFCCVRGNQRGWIAGNLVTISSAGTASVTPTRITTSAVTPTPRSPNTPPPPSLGLAPIYTKYLQARGAHIVALADVNDRALLQARDILFGMTSTRPELFSAMTRTGLRIIIFNHRTTPLQELPEFKDWPLAAIYTGGFAKDASGYTIAAPEYQLKCTPILVHEIAHAIDYELQPHAPWFSEKRDSAYQNAMADGLWSGEYAATNKHEYWAVAVERHFRRQVDEATLSQKDPELAELVFSVFGDAKIPPCR